MPGNIIEAVQARVPGMTSEVAPRRDLWGEKIESAGGRLTLVDPFNSKQSVEDPLVKEARALDVNLSIPGRSISYIKMDPHEFSIYQRERGKALKQNLTNLVNHPEYQKLNLQDKQDQFERVIRETNSYYQNTVFVQLMVERYNLGEMIEPGFGFKD